MICSQFADNPLLPPPGTKPTSFNQSDPAINFTKLDDSEKTGGGSSSLNNNTNNNDDDNFQPESDFNKSDSAVIFNNNTNRNIDRNLRAMNKPKPTWGEILKLRQEKDRMALRPTTSRRGSIERGGANNNKSSSNRSSNSKDSGSWGKEKGKNRPPSVIVCEGSISSDDDSSSDDDDDSSNSSSSSSDSSSSSSSSGSNSSGSSSRSGRRSVDNSTLTSTLLSGGNEGEGIDSSSRSGTKKSDIDHTNTFPIPISNQRRDRRASAPPIPIPNRRASVESTGKDSTTSSKNNKRRATIETKSATTNRRASLSRRASDRSSSKSASLEELSPSQEEIDEDDDEDDSNDGNREFGTPSPTQLKISSASLSVGELSNSERSPEEDDDDPTERRRSSATSLVERLKSNSSLSVGELSNSERDGNGTDDSDDDSETSAERNFRESRLMRQSQLMPFPIEGQKSMRGANLTAMDDITDDEDDDGSLLEHSDDDHSDNGHSDDEEHEQRLLRESQLMPFPTMYQGSAGLTKSVMGELALDEIDEGDDEDDDEEEDDEDDDDDDDDAIDADSDANNPMDFESRSHSSRVSDNDDAASAASSASDFSDMSNFTEMSDVTQQDDILSIPSEHDTAEHSGTNASSLLTAETRLTAETYLTREGADSLLTYEEASSGERTSSLLTAETRENTDSLLTVEYGEDRAQDLLTRGGIDKGESMLTIVDSQFSSDGNQGLSSSAVSQKSSETDSSNKPLSRMGSAKVIQRADGRRGHEINRRSGLMKLNSVQFDPENEKDTTTPQDNDEDGADEFDESKPLRSSGGDQSISKSNRSGYSMKEQLDTSAKSKGSDDNSVRNGGLSRASSGRFSIAALEVSERSGGTASSKTSSKSNKDDSDDSNDAIVPREGEGSSHSGSLDDDSMGSSAADDKSNTDGSVTAESGSLVNSLKARLKENEANDNSRRPTSGSASFVSVQSRDAVNQAPKISKYDFSSSEDEQSSSSSSESSYRSSDDDSSSSSGMSRFSSSSDYSYGSSSSYSKSSRSGSSRSESTMSSRRRRSYSLDSADSKSTYSLEDSRRKDAASKRSISRSVGSKQSSKSSARKSSLGSISIGLDDKEAVKDTMKLVEKSGILAVKGGPSAEKAHVVKDKARVRDTAAEEVALARVSRFMERSFNESNKDHKMDAEEEKVNDETDVPAKDEEPVVADEPRPRSKRVQFNLLRLSRGKSLKGLGEDDVGEGEKQQTPRKSRWIMPKRSSSRTLSDDESEAPKKLLKAAQTADASSTIDSHSYRGPIDVDTSAPPKGPIDMDTSAPPKGGKDEDLQDPTREHQVSFSDLTDGAPRPRPRRKSTSDRDLLRDEHNNHMVETRSTSDLTSDRPANGSGDYPVASAISTADDKEEELVAEAIAMSLPQAVPVDDEYTNEFAGDDGMEGNRGGGKMRRSLLARSGSHMKKMFGRPSRNRHSSSNSLGGPRDNGDIRSVASDGHRGSYDSYDRRQHYASQYQNRRRPALSNEDERFGGSYRSNPSGSGESVRSRRTMDEYYRRRGEHDDYNDSLPRRRQHDRGGRGDSSVVSEIYVDRPRHGQPVYGRDGGDSGSVSSSIYSGYQGGPRPHHHYHDPRHQTPYPPNYYQHPSPRGYNHYRGGPPRDPGDVRWDELGDPIQAALESSLRDISSQVVGKQRRVMQKETPVSDVDLGPWQCADCSFVNGNGRHLQCGVCGKQRTM